MATSKLNLSKYYDKEHLEKLSNVANRIPFNRFPQLRIRYILLGVVACIILWTTCSSSGSDDSYDESSSPNPIQQDRTLILYSYSESTNPTAKSNAIFFLRHAVNTRADYAFILNGHTTLDIESLLLNLPSSSSSLTKPKKPLSSPTDNNNERISLIKTYGTYPSNPSNIKNDPTSGRMIKIYTRATESSAAKKCYRIGAFSDALMHSDRLLLKSYKRFVLLDSSLRGPFMPSYTARCWQDVYTSKLSLSNKFVGGGIDCNSTITVTTTALPDEFGDDVNKLAGGALAVADMEKRNNNNNGKGKGVISTSIYAIDRPALSYLLRHGPLNTCPGDKEKTEEAERSIPEVLEKAGYGVSTHLHGVEVERYCEAEVALVAGSGGGEKRTSVDRGMFRRYEKEEQEEERLTGWVDVVGIGGCDGGRE